MAWSPTPEEPSTAVSKEERDRALAISMHMGRCGAASWPHAYEEMCLAKEEAIAKAYEDGCADGQLVGQIHLCERRLKQPPTPRDELLRLGPTELSRLAGQLERQLFGEDAGTAG